MAMFRHHIALGAVLATTGVIVIYFYSFITDPIYLLIAFVLCTVGSFLPDVDSDSGIPFYLMFGAVTLAFGGVVLYYTLLDQPTNKYILFGVPLAALLFFWFVIGKLFKECTHHRGIWHSIPALGIAATATFIISQYFHMSREVSLIFSAAIAVGFASHLVLDELVSEVNPGGIPILGARRSLGTALKFFSESHKVNFFTYALLIGLVYIALHPIVH
jgi:hypothetical protein